MTDKNELKIDLPNLPDTQSFASILAKYLQPGLCIYLQGDLGAGKTTLVRALLVALGVTEHVKSPTYTLVESYELKDYTVYHFDLYRLTDASELEHIGIRDYTSGNAVCMFEWADKGLGTIPAADLEIKLDFKQQGRSATITAHSYLGIELISRISKT